MIIELNQLNEEFLRELVDQRNEKEMLDKQAEKAKEYVNSSYEARQEFIAKARDYEISNRAHVAPSLDRGVDASFNSRMELELQQLNAITLDNLTELKNESAVNGLSDDNLNEFISKQRERLHIATERYDALREENRMLTTEMSEIRARGGDYFEIRDAILKTEAKLGAGIAEIINARDELNQASEELRERMFQRGEYLNDNQHPVAESYKEHLIEYDLSKGQIQRNLIESKGVVESVETDLGRLYQRLAQSEKQLQQLESRWDSLRLEEDLVRSEIIAIQKAMPDEKNKLTEADFSNSVQITRKGNNDLEELKTYYRNNSFDNFAVGSRANQGYGPNLTGIESRDLAFARRQENLLNESKSNIESNPLKAERIDNLRQFEYHEYKAAVNNKIGNMPGVGTEQDLANAKYHDAQSGKFATRLAEIDYQIAKEASKDNGMVQMPVRLAVLSDSVRKSEAIKERYEEQVMHFEMVKVFAQFNQVIVSDPTKYSQMQEDLSDLRRRAIEINASKQEIQLSKQTITNQIEGARNQLIEKGVPNYAAIRQQEDGTAVKMLNKSGVQAEKAKDELKKIRIERELVKANSQATQEQQSRAMNHE